MGHRTAQGAGLSSREVVLGLLIERPGNSYQLDLRLAGRLGAAAYGRGTARHALKSLEGDGLIQPLDGGVQPDEDGRRGTAYRATPKGVAYFRRWLRASTSLPPVREELHAKIVLCRPEDLPLLIAAVKDAEMACTLQLEEANMRVRSERTALGEDVWSKRMGIIASSGVAAWWDSRIKWLQGVRRHLQSEDENHQRQRTAGSSARQG